MLPFRLFDLSFLLLQEVAPCNTQACVPVTRRLLVMSCVPPVRRCCAALPQGLRFRRLGQLEHMLPGDRRRLFQETAEPGAGDGRRQGAAVDLRERQFCLWGATFFVQACNGTTVELKACQIKPQEAGSE